MNDGRAGLAERFCCSSLALRPTLSSSLPFALFLDAFSPSSMRSGKTPFHAGIWHVRALIPQLHDTE